MDADKCFCDTEDGMTLQIEDDLSPFFAEPERGPEQAGAGMIVVELFRRRLISGGRGAELLGMTRLEFIRRAGELGIPYFAMSREELEADMDAAGKLFAGRNS
jgi:predicted HTH domain antitoxin